MPILLELAPIALRLLFQKTYEQHQNSLKRALMAYQLAQHIHLPRQPALQTQGYRLAALVRYANSFMALLTEKTLQYLDKALRQGLDDH